MGGHHLLVDLSRGPSITSLGLWLSASHTRSARGEQLRRCVSRLAIAEMAYRPPRPAVSRWPDEEEQQDLVGLVFPAGGVDPFRRAATAAVLSSREETIASFNRFTSKVKRMRENEEDMCWFATDHGQRNTKPASSFSDSPDPSSCTPICLGQLQLNTTHRGRILRGTVVSEEPCVMKSVHVLLEDEEGAVGMISVYNFLPLPDLLARQKRRGSITYRDLVMEAIRLGFGKGSHVGILEPFFKVKMDGSLGIRVDNPKEVVFFESAYFTSYGVDEWQEQGKKHMQAGEVAEAAKCYDKALKIVNRDGELCKVLLNLSASHVKLGSLGLGLAAAAACAAVDPSNAKFLYRAAAALAGLQAWEELQWCSAEAVGKGVAYSAAAEQWDEAVRACDPPEGVPRTFKRMLKAQSQRPHATWQQVLLTILVSLEANSSGDDHLNESNIGSEALPGTGLDLEGMKALKESGNRHFQSGNLSDAVSDYTAAVSRASRAAVLLSNKAQCALKSDRHWEALADANAALLFDPQQLKAHYRKAVALRNLSFLREARAACGRGMLLPSYPGTGSPHLPTPLAALQSEITAAIDALDAVDAVEIKASTSGNPRGVDDGDPRHHWSEKAQKEVEQGQACSVEEVAALNLMFSMIPSSEFRKRLNVDFEPVDNRIKPFHLMFSREGRWPRQVDVPRAESVLRTAYEQGRAMFMHRLHHFADGFVPEKMRLSPGMLIKRLGTNDPQRAMEVLTAPLGSVFWKPKRDFDPYRANLLYHSFSNAPNHAEMISRGKTHVSVGFCDLGELLAATFVGDSGDQVRWVGYDSTPYAVAKALVVHEMMVAGAEVDWILAVWYSSAWSPQAKASFRSAVTLLLKKKLHPDVVQVLLHWQTHDVSLAAARKMWLQSVGGASYIGNFVADADLMALCAYAITGELPLSARCGREAAAEGSVAMFCVPASCGERSMEENFLQTISNKSLWEERIASSLDIVSAGVKILREGVQRLQRMVRSREIVIDIRLGALQPGETALMSEIRQMRPWTMSWSNICDYCPPEDFHRMARMCSSPENTVHHAYTMNWVQEVSGACVIDHRSAAFRKEILEMAEKAISLQFAVSGVSNLLLKPAVSNPLNEADYGLSMAVFRKWTDAFFEKAGKVQVGEIFPPVYSLGCLSRTNSTVNMTFTYDMSIRFDSARKSPTKDELLTVLEALGGEDLPMGFDLQHMKSELQAMMMAAES